MAKKRKPEIGIVMGSDSDWATVKPATATLASFGIEYHVSDNMSLGVSYTSYNMDNKEIGGYDKDLTYDKVGLSVIYGFQILNAKGRNEKK